MEATRAPVLADGPVRSFKLRRGRVTGTQAEAIARLWPALGVEVDGTPLDLPALFGRRAPVVLEVGPGMGEATARMAAAEPGTDLLTVDVHTPGHGNLLKLVEAAGLSNVRVGAGDALVLLRRMLAPESLVGVRVFFPDPWPKRKHRERRLLQPAVLALIASRLRPGGVFHAATDIADYAEQIARTGDAEPLLSRLVGPTAVSLVRPVTKFEGRAVRAEVAVTDLVWGRLAP